MSVLLDPVKMRMEYVNKMQVPSLVVFEIL